MWILYLRSENCQTRVSVYNLSVLFSSINGQQASSLFLSVSGRVIVKLDLHMIKHCFPAMFKKRYIIVLTSQPCSKSDRS